MSFMLLFGFFENSEFYSNCIFFLSLPLKVKCYSERENWNQQSRSLNIALSLSVVRYHIQSEKPRCRPMTALCVYLVQSSRWVWWSSEDPPPPDTVPARPAVWAQADASAAVSEFSTDLQFGSKPAAEWTSQFSLYYRVRQLQSTVTFENGSSVLYLVRIINRRAHTHTSTKWDIMRKAKPLPNPTATTVVSLGK